MYLTLKTTKMNSTRQNHLKIIKGIKGQHIMCLLKKLSEAVMMIKDYKLYMFIYECINARKACKTGLLNAISNIK